MDDGTLMKVLEAIVGEKSAKIISILLSSNSSMTDEEIGNALGVRVNEVRRLLYELASQGFVMYSRSTKESSRWHTYSWYTDKSIIRQAMAKRLRGALRILEQWIEYGASTVMYVCPYDYALYTFDDAFENSFRCIKCGSDLIELNPSEFVPKLRKIVEMLKTSV